MWLDEILNEAVLVDYRSYNIKAKYAELNRRLFGGKLPDIPIAFKPLKGMAGVVQAKVAGHKLTRSDPRVRLGLADRFSGATIKPGSQQMFLDNRFARTEQQVVAVLVHEMIHVYFNTIGKFSENHGPEFLAMVRRLSQILGFEVPVTEKTTGVELADPNAALRPVAVLLILKNDNRYTYAVLNSSSVRQTAVALEQYWAYRIQHSMVKRVTLAVVAASPVWNALAAVVPIQRTLTSPRTPGVQPRLASLRLYFLTQEGAAEAFWQTGEIWFDLKK